jgi:hypothetical protein
LDLPPTYVRPPSETPARQHIVELFVRRNGGEKAR